ncbi:unnamed protein product [Sympodiomycopsis kandeliae]
MPANLRPRRPTVNATSNSGSVNTSSTATPSKRHQTMDTIAAQRPGSVSFSPTLKIDGTESGVVPDADWSPSRTPSLATDSSRSASSGDSNVSSQPPLPATPTSRTGSPSSAELLGLYGPRPVRAQFACDYCRQRKAKCSGTEPCDRCIAKKQNCSFSTVQNQRKVTRSLRDLHADRLGAHCHPDADLRGGIKVYLDRQAHRMGGQEHHMSGLRRTVMSQGNGTSHMNHVHWALSAQQQQRLAMMGSASASAHPYWSGRQPSVRYSGGYSGGMDNNSSSWMNGLVGAGQEALYGYNGSWYPSSAYGHGHDGPSAQFNIGNQTESEVGYSMSAPGSAISTSTTPGGSNTPHLVTHPLGGQEARRAGTHGVAALESDGPSLLADTDSSFVRGEGNANALMSNGVYPVHNAYASATSGSEEDTLYSTGNRPGWRYDPLPPPPASVVLGQHHQVQGDHNVNASLEDQSNPSHFSSAQASGYYLGLPPRNLASMNTAATSTSCGTSSPNGAQNDSSEQLNEAAHHHHQGNLLISASDLGFRPPSPC